MERIVGDESGYSEDGKAMNERHQAEMKELQESYKQKRIGKAPKEGDGKQEREKLEKQYIKHKSDYHEEYETEEHGKKGQKQKRNKGKGK